MFGLHTSSTVGGARGIIRKYRKPEAPRSTRKVWLPHKGNIDESHTLKQRTYNYFSSSPSYRSVKQ